MSVYHIGHSKKDLDNEETGVYTCFCKGSSCPVVLCNRNLRIYLPQTNNPIKPMFTTQYLSLLLLPDQGREGVAKK